MESKMVHCCGFPGYMYDVWWEILWRNSDSETVFPCLDTGHQGSSLEPGLEVGHAGKHLMACQHGACHAGPQSLDMARKGNVSPHFHGPSTKGVELAISGGRRLQKFALGTNFGPYSKTFGHHWLSYLIPTNVEFRHHRWDKVNLHGVSSNYLTAFHRSYALQ